MKIIKFIIVISIALVVILVMISYIANSKLINNGTKYVKHVNSAYDLENTIWFVNDTSFPISYYFMNNSEYMIIDLSTGMKRIGLWKVLDNNTIDLDVNSRFDNQPKHELLKIDNNHLILGLDGGDGWMVKSTFKRIK